MRTFLSVLMCLFASAVYSQQPDSLLLQKAHFNSSLRYQAQGLQSVKTSSRFTPREIALPITAVVFGFSSLYLQNVKELNLEAKEEIVEHTNHFRTKIDDYLQFAPAATVFVAGFSGVKTTHNFKDRAILLGMSTAIMAGTVAFLKKATHELRPNGSAYNSFPSGHTANAFSGAAFMEEELGTHTPLLAYSGYGMATATGVLRMLNNRHWLGDVIAGAGIGILSTKTAYWLFEKLKKKPVAVTIL